MTTTTNYVRLVRNQSGTVIENHEADTEIAALREHIEQQRQPKRAWVGLTVEDQKILADSASANNWNDWQMMDAVETKLKEKNT